MPERGGSWFQAGRANPYQGTGGVQVRGQLSARTCPQMYRLRLRYRGME
jgi:hypothetical protein